MTTSATEPGFAETLRSTIPARIDRLPWSSFHTRLVLALGVAWILDGLEISVASSVEGALTKSDTLNMSAAGSTTIATVYLVGQVLGALVFGLFADKWGRRKLFMITLGVYLVGSGLSAATAGAGSGWVLFLYATRFIAGTGIGGEYAAINSAIDELIPARFRGRVDIAVNGTYWAGAMIGTFATFLFLTTIPASVGWRLGFLLGPVLGLVIIYVRRNLPESPRWLIMHGKPEEAEAAIAGIEAEVRAGGGELSEVGEDQALEIQPADRTGYFALLRVLLRDYFPRSVLGLGLMVTQSFLYNAIFFSYSIVLTVFYHVNGSAALYGIAFAVGNLIGPFVLGPLFDTVGRKRMISGSYLIAGVLLTVSAFLFKAQVFNAVTQTAAWVIIFFFASAGASAAYLTVSEIFPQEVRAKAIAVFFSIAQVVGALATQFYGFLIDKNHPDFNKLFIGYITGAVIMIVGGLIAVFFGVAAEGRSLESVARPLGVVKSAAQKVTGLGGGGDSPAGGVVAGE
ncbi:MAG TPA: MFS transporter [Pseudonocardiaceae bacterium]|nr:MFS transporter [Pseudonocardiaceae bacterium]